MIAKPAPGINPLATDSEGEVWENPKAYYQAERKLARWQRPRHGVRNNPAAGGKHSARSTACKGTPTAYVATPCIR